MKLLECTPNVQQRIDAHSTSDGGWSVYVWSEPDPRHAGRYTGVFQVVDPNAQQVELPGFVSQTEDGVPVHYPLLTLQDELAKHGFTDWRQL